MPMTDLGDEDERVQPGRVRQVLGRALRGARRLFGTGGATGGRVRRARR
jgi:hypothetical protein